MQQLILPLDDFYYITAANNYIKAYLKDNAIVYTIVRMTMKGAMEEALLPQSSKVSMPSRFHIVNLDKAASTGINARYK